MRLNFRRLEMHNFMSFEDEVFEFQNSSCLNLICGKNNDIPGLKNGCGKTCLVEALAYSMFGQTRNKISSKNIHNKFVKGKDTRVVVYFDVQEKKYRIASGFSNSGKAYCEVHDITDGELCLTKSTIAETRKFIEDELTCCDFSIFLRTVILSSDQSYNFFELSKQDKKDFIEKLFDITVFGNMYASLHRKLLDLDKEIIAVQSKIIVLNKQEEHYKSIIHKFNTERAKKREDIEKKLSNIQKQYNSVKDQKVEVNSKLLSKYQQAADKLEVLISKCEDQLRSSNSKLSQCKTEMSFAERSISQCNANIGKHKEIIEKLCSDCVPIFKKHYKIDVDEKQILQLSEKSESLKTKSLSLSESIKMLSSKLSEYRNKLETANLKIHELTKQSNMNEKQLKMLETDLESAKSEKKLIERQDNPYISLLESNSESLKHESEVLADHTEKHNYLKIAESIVSQDTIRKMVISDLISLLNNKIKTYLTKFGAKYTVVFDSDMNYEFITDAGTYEYKNFSSGERARIMIAACFAFKDFMFMKNNFSSNVLILDEFIDNAIDGQAIESILDILKQFSKLQNQSIYVISHRSEIGNTMFDSTIQIEKTKNISSIHYIENS